MMNLTRREAVKYAAAGIAAAVNVFGMDRCFASALPGQDEITAGERDAMAQVAAGFMQKFNVPGLSVAIARSGRLVYQGPFGIADPAAGEKVSPSHLFRIASVTKPITSAAIFALIQQQKIHPGDRVFGENGILRGRYGTIPYGEHIEDITIDHLLTHTCGGWDNGPGDPMFLNPRVDAARLISWTLDNRPLGNPPGTHWAYSNFGYCVLGRVIEAVTGRTYRDYVQQEVLAPCGISGMLVAGNTLEQRASNEVTYYGQNGENPYGMNVGRMDSHGGWLATPTDLVRFATHVDGFATTPNILNPDTIKSMTAPCAVNEHYARGWQVNRFENWWHNGSLPGTSTIMVRTSSGFCWAALANTRCQPHNAIDSALDSMVWDMARKVRSWRL